MCFFFLMPQCAPFACNFYGKQVNSDGTEYVLDDEECPLPMLMNHPTSRGMYT